MTPAAGAGTDSATRAATAAEPGAIAETSARYEVRLARLRHHRCVRMQVLLHAAAAAMGDANRMRVVLVHEP